MRKRLSLFIASAAYVGLIPGAPGTYASLGTTVVFFLLCHLWHHLSPGLHMSAVCLISFIGVFAAHEVSLSSGLDDPQIVVIDEVAGQLTTFLFVPPTWFNLVSGTVLFRLLDIWKPYPIRRLEPLPKGVGIIADDLLAGVYGNLVLHLVHRLLKI